MTRHTLWTMPTTGLGLATEIAKVYAIAPELETKFKARNKQLTVGVATVVEGLEYILTLNNVTYSYISLLYDTADIILDNLASGIPTTEFEVVIYGEKLHILCKELHDVQTNCNVNLDIDIEKSYHDFTYLLDLILDDVALQVTEDKFFVETERAQRYLVAHLLTLVNLDDYGIGTRLNVKAETVADIRLVYGTADSGNIQAYYSSTRYGSIFYEIMERRFFRFL